MRRLILIGAMALLATEALAGGSRSLSLAASPANQQPADKCSSHTAVGASSGGNAFNGSPHGDYHSNGCSGRNGSEPHSARAIHSCSRDQGD
ncbi:hypothetical protein [Bradyrhizobium sp. 199]|uniref:hypothetical protein n=1 Tax=Bradyrhizobium sp. 199 TaxID=2782664 RepID=UPI00321196A0